LPKYNYNEEIEALPNRAIQVRKTSGREESKNTNKIVIYALSTIISDKLEKVTCYNNLIKQML